MMKDQGEKTTHMELSKSFYWPDMKENVKHYVQTCLKCQGTKSM
jgi:hypothetical protein